MGESTGPALTLFEEITGRLGYEKLSDNISILPHPLVLWGIIVFFVDVIILQGIKEVAGYQATFLNNPTWLVQPILGLFAPFVVVYLHNRYTQMLKDIDIDSRTSNPNVFNLLVPQKVRVALYIILVSYTIYIFFYDISISTVTQIGGLSELIGVGIILPLGYGIIFAEFFATYIGILVYLPRKIRRTDFKINFLDPEGLGGLRPAGELMKSAYYFVVIGLIGYAIVLYGPSIVNDIAGWSYDEPGFVQDLLFTSVWILAISTMIYGLSQIHWFMKRTRRRELTRLDKEARDVVEYPFDMEKFEIKNEREYDEIRRQMERINNTQEYPTTFTMWVQISIGIILPKAVQLLLSSV